MKRTLFFFVLIGCILLFSYWYNSPKHLASSPDNIDRFFDIPSEVVNNYHVVDKMFSQGKTCFAFGKQGYCIKVRNNSALGMAMMKVGATETDSTWVLEKMRGNYHGRLSVSKRDNLASLIYTELNEE